MRAGYLFPLVGLLLAGCVHTQEVALAPNIVRINTQASGLLSVGTSADVTMRKAAEATLRAGYTHFKLDQVQLSQGSQVGAIVGTDNGNGLSTVSAIRRPTESEGVTVVMFRADDPRAKDAFNAADVLKQYQ